MGLATALAFAHRGQNVFGYDIRPDLREQLRTGRLPIHEKDLPALFRQEQSAGRFQVVDSWEELVGPSEVIYLCLPTPRKESGRIDLGPMRSGVAQLGRALRGAGGYRLVVVKSTVVPGTTENAVRRWLERAAGKGPRELGVAANPEFLAEGTMVRDALSPSRIVVGVRDTRDAAILRRIYRGFRSPLVVLTPTGAELVKYASNAFLALKVTFANEFSRFAERTGTDIDAVMAAVGSDPRIGERFLSAGPGFGGSCLEKDLRAIVARARELGVELPVLREVLRSNSEQTAHAVELTVQALDGCARPRVAVLGLAFKPGTDDVRESRAIPLVESLARRGHEVRVHDPAALGNFRSELERSGSPAAGRLRYCRSVEEALNGADLAVIQAAWPTYARWPGAWSRCMRRPFVLDLRRALPPERRDQRGLVWKGLGTGTISE
jgi:UDPglucose 6-dehydrogenase